jgi:hypothetical protein
MEAIFVPVRYLYESGNPFNQRLGEGTSMRVKKKFIVSRNLKQQISQTFSCSRYIQLQAYLSVLPMHASNFLQILGTFQDPLGILIVNLQRLVAILFPSYGKDL